MSKKTTVQANINDEKRVVKTKEFLVHKFSESELMELSEEMARNYQEQIQLENEKKMVAAEFTAKIEGKKAAIESFAQKISNRQEHRHVDVHVEMNTPINGKKTGTRMDTGEVIWQKNMTPEELQLRLDLDPTDAMATHSEYQDNHK